MLVRKGLVGLHRTIQLQLLQCYWYPEELYKKDLHNQDNHDGVITNLEPDILECKVKWALGGGDGIPAELF